MAMLSPVEIDPSWRFPPYTLATSGAPVIPQNSDTGLQQLLLKVGPAYYLVLQSRNAYANGYIEMYKGVADGSGGITWTLLDEPLLIDALGQPTAAVATIPAPKSDGWQLGAYYDSDRKRVYTLLTYGSDFYHPERTFHHLGVAALNTETDRWEPSEYEVTPFAVGHGDTWGFDKYYFNQRPDGSRIMVFTSAVEHLAIPGDSNFPASRVTVAKQAAPGEAWTTITVLDQGQAADTMIYGARIRPDGKLDLMLLRQAPVTGTNENETADLYHLCIGEDDTIGPYTLIETDVAFDYEGTGGEGGIMDYHKSTKRIAFIYVYKQHYEHSYGDPQYSDGTTKVAIGTVDEDNPLIASWTTEALSTLDGTGIGKVVYPQEYLEGYMAQVVFLGSDLYAYQAAKWPYPIDDIGGPVDSPGSIRLWRQKRLDVDSWAEPELIFEPPYDPLVRLGFGIKGFLVFPFCSGEPGVVLTYNESFFVFGPAHAGRQSTYYAGPPPGRPAPPRCLSSYAY